MTKYSGPTRKKAAWCPLTGTLQTAMTEPASSHAAVDLQPDGGSDDSHKRVNRGAGIAVQSIKTLIHNKSLLWFSFLAGLVILLITLAEIYLIIFMLNSGNYSYWSLYYKQGLVLTFAIEIISIFCLNFLFAGLILNLDTKSTGQPVNIRKGLSLAKSHVQSITGWSFILALLGTAIYTIIVHHPYFGHLFPALVTFTLYIPFVYYIPDILLSAISFVFIKMFVNVFLFILTMFVIPMLVLENKSLPDAVTGSILYLKKTWIEIIVCFLIFGLFLSGITLIDPVIRMTPAFVDYDYHFFSVYSLEMAAVCIMFLIGWWIATVIGFTVAGIAVFNLYTLGKTGKMPVEFEDQKQTFRNESVSVKSQPEIRRIR